MKFGVCCSLDKALLVQEAGYDFFELGFGAFADQSEEEFQKAKQQVRALSIYPEAMNGMLPGRFRLTGEEADLTPVKPFLERGFARAAEVGTRVVVFGSGSARRMPEGFTDMARAYNQLEEYLLLTSDCAAENGINIAIEPLSFRDCNVINLVSQGAYLAGRVNRPNVRVLADYFHVEQNKENPESIVGFAHRMEHCHLANPITRKQPLPDDGVDYSPFFSALNRAGYEKRVSIEGYFDWDNAKTKLPGSLRLMKTYANF